MISKVGDVMSRVGGVNKNFKIKAIILILLKINFSVIII